MPYDLPLVAYGKDELPWCASMSYEETDWQGQNYIIE
jgi:tyrosyl-DNA phosphodiesterase-1